jgi:glucose/arabinose dehydrogenase
MPKGSRPKYPANRKNLGFLPSFCLVLTILFMNAIVLQSAEKSWLEEWDLPDGFTMSVDTEGFNFPTAIAFVPNPGSDPKSPLYFVTEIRGKIKVVTRDRSTFTFAQVPLDSTPPKELPDLEGEEGMAGIALDSAHGYVFVSLAYYDTNQVLRNALVRFETEPGVFSLKPKASLALTSLFEKDISMVTHQAGAIAVERNSLFVSVGDGGQYHQSQNVDSTLGKVLRMSLDFKPLPDNPFYESEDCRDPRNFVWALGLRNPFGLARVAGRTFASENGYKIDRFLEIEKGRNYGWNGTDWSIGMNAPMVIGPTVAPVHVAWLPPDSAIFPDEYRSQFFVALASGHSGSAGVLLIDYDFEKSRLAKPPKPLLVHARKEHSRVSLTGIAFGPDALYVVPLFSVKGNSLRTSEILRIAYDPSRRKSSGMDANDRAEVLMFRKDCFSCHSRNASDPYVAPALDRETLIPNIIARLNSESYKRSVRALSKIKETPYRCYNQARQLVLNESGMDQVRIWLKYHLLEPKFDRINSAMPNLGLTNHEAEEIADYLVRRNIGSTGVPGFFKRMTNPYIYGPVSRRHLPAVFLGGFVSGLGMLGLGRLVRKRKLIRRKKGQPSVDNSAAFIVSNSIVSTN